MCSRNSVFQKWSPYTLMSGETWSHPLLQTSSVQTGRRAGGRFCGAGAMLQDVARQSVHKAHEETLATTARLQASWTYVDSGLMQVMCDTRWTQEAWEGVEEPSQAHRCHQRSFAAGMVSWAQKDETDIIFLCEGMAGCQRLMRQMEAN